MPNRLYPQPGEFTGSGHRQRNLESAKNAMAEWQEKRTAALGDLHLSVDTAADAVDAQIGIIDQIRETAGRINSLRHDRIEKIRKDVSDFENVVSQLVQVVAPGLADKAADDAVAALETRHLRLKRGGAWSG